MRQFPASNRYFYFDSNEYVYDADHKIILHEEIHDWLIENNMLYEIMWAQKTIYRFTAAIRFDSKEAAMAFKLRWI